MEHKTISTTASLRKVILLEDSYFLQYMQMVWAYYQELAPPKALELEIIKDFSHNLTLLERAIAVFTESASAHAIASTGSSVGAKDKHTVARLRVRLMNSFNTLVDAVETFDNLPEDAQDKCARDHFLKGIVETYEHIRLSPESASRYSDCFKTCKLCEACPLLPKCTRRKQGEETND